MTEENDGILGNLPRSRPGVRSEKRAGGKRTAAAGGAPGATPRAKPKAKSTTPKPRAGTAKPPPPPPPPPAPKSDDPITLAVRTAGQVAETGFKVASRMAGEVLRRLPRP
jgi:hypothetical protein